MSNRPRAFAPRVLAAVPLLIALAAPSLALPVAAAAGQHPGPSGQTALVRPNSSTLWGIDTVDNLQTSNDIAQTEAAMGTPQFAGRYLIWGSTTLGSSEAQYLYQQGLPILLVDSPSNDSSLIGSSTGTSEANGALAQARSLGVSAGSAIFRDVESGASIDSAYIQAWYTAFAGTGFVPGFYENSYTSGPDLFPTSYCQAVSTNSSLAAGTVLFASENELTSYDPYRADMPAWNASVPSCANTTVAWQYKERGLFPAGSWPNVDVDEFQQPYASYLWNGNSSATPTATPAPGSTATPTPSGPVHWQSSSPNGATYAPGATFNPDAVAYIPSITLNCAQDFLENQDGNLFGTGADVGCSSQGNSTYDFHFYTGMTAPQTGGSYTSRWQIWHYPNLLLPAITFSFNVAQSTPTPSNTPTITPTPSQTPMPTQTPLPTSTPPPTDTPPPTSTPSQTPVPTSTATSTPTSTATQTLEPSHTPTSPPTSTYTPTSPPTATQTPGAAASATSTPSATNTSSAGPVHWTSWSPNGVTYAPGATFNPDAVAYVPSVTLDCSQDFLENQDGNLFGTGPDVGCAAQGNNSYEFHFDTDMTAPTSPGTYTSRWQIWHYPNLLVQSVTFSFTVSPATATPSPTATGTATDTPTPPPTNTATKRPTHTPTSTATSTLTPTPKLANLVVTALGSPPASVHRGGTFAVQDTTKNIGSKKASATNTEYYLSTNGVRPGAFSIGLRAIPALGPGVQSSGTATVTVGGSTPLGTYHLLACANALNQVKESTKADNCLDTTATVKVLKKAGVVQPGASTPADVRQARFAI